MEKKTWFIVNPIAGGGITNSVKKKLEEFESDQKQRILYSRHAGESESLANKALESGAEIVVAVGGDGTVNEVAKALITKEAALGIIPTGSGNGLARELGLSMNPSKALIDLNTLSPKFIDVGKVNDHPFFCASGVGFDAQVSQLFQDAKGKRGFSKYIEISVTEYFRSKELPFELELNGNQKLNANAWFITISNSRQFGNNAIISPLAKLDDGLLDFTIVPKFQLWNISLPAIQLFQGSIHKNKKIKTGKVSSIRIEQLSDWVHLDGEPKKLGKELNYSIDRFALRVLYKA